MKSKKLLKTVFGGLMSALVCVATAVLVIQLPTGGYANLGDCFVIISSCVLGPIYGGLAGGIGSAFADLFLGYGIYAPFTFIIKFSMAVVAYLIIKTTKNKSFVSQITSLIIAVIVAELIMVGGYFVLEVFMYGIEGAIANVIGNAVQALFACVSTTVVYSAMNKARLFSYINKLLLVK